MDLFLKDKILLYGKNKNKIQVIDDELTGVEFLDLILNKIKTFIATHEEDPSLFSIFDTSIYKVNEEIISSRLESQGIIKYIGNKYWFRRYQILNVELKEKILNEIYLITGYEKYQKLTKEMIFLLSLLNFKRYNKRKVGSSRLRYNKWLKKIIKQEPIGKWLKAQEYKNKNDFHI